MADIGNQQNPSELSWQKVKKIFAGALLLQPEERPKYIFEQCRDDKTLADEVESLLNSYDDAALFLESPAVEILADEIINDSPELSEGKFLKHYQIIRKIGAGGMGEVYLANDKKLDREVAIKILTGTSDKDEANLRRFLREAKTASKLNHPHIMVVHEIGTFENINYIVCEFIRGKTLNAYVEENKTSLIRILDLCIQISNALDAAHQIGIIHRDIKPDNIMVRDDGFIKILDFGLAKFTRKNKT